MQIEIELVTGKDKKEKDIVQKRIFVMGKVKARMVRKSVQIGGEVDFNKLTVEDLDKLVNFLCETYANQFTIDQVYDGMESDVLIPILINTVQGITTGVTERLEKFPQK